MSAQATHRMCWTLWDPRTAEAGSGRRHRNRHYSDSEKLCDEPQSALGVPMRKMASNLGCRSMKKAVGALREGVAFVLSHELGEDTRSWEVWASLGRGQHSKFLGISQRVYPRKSLSGNHGS